MSASSPRGSRCTTIWYVRNDLEGAQRPRSLIRRIWSALHTARAMRRNRAEQPTLVPCTHPDSLSAHPAESENKRETVSEIVF
ncbi:uncharacterized protein THITE_2122590 [Thermothielavioides terrestris NRRL 8126]|uniref:Uncharacterized protein n=1 Tax=Thermothielavioides terrestris (strain ATCC 38088 / NRRL 8126) TaxID=578455 RepID=G2RDM0_THETT|nr:uncharacterized protein THITE_2122590 [Thermothielavioides terrestris NRRL 8126]AEO70805.1 hypothetical protein THITE_2122590 [Thermothielavioides terrestris NRRL 8126]